MSRDVFICLIGNPCSPTSESLAHLAFALAHLPSDNWTDSHLPGYLYTVRWEMGFRSLCKISWG